MQIVQLGLGGVGQALARQYLELDGRYPHLSYLALADRSGLCHVPGGWAAEELSRLLRLKADGGTVGELANALGERAHFVAPGDTGLPDLAPVLSRERAGADGAENEIVVVDATAERGTYDTLLQARSMGAHVVTCNKWPLAETTARYEALMQAGGGRSRIRFETTVGAALPVISSLEKLLQTGDRVSRIEAAVSGTLGYLFSRLGEGATFSGALAEAHRLGYTEPDPRDDLAGVDAQRKALILARVLGYRLDMQDVRVESLVPEGLEGVSLDRFWWELPAHDAYYAGRVEAAGSRGNFLRYLATIDPSGAAVGLVEVARDSQMGSLWGTDNLFVFHTRRYCEQPLSIRGPGAGAEVTASGVMSDILSLLA